MIVVPGKWTIPELRYQAEHVATMLVNNAGFNCVSARVVVTHAGWSQRDAFLGALAQTLAEITTRRAYYPGAAERRDAFVAAHPEAEELGRGPDDALPWTFIPGVPPGRVDDVCFNVESFFGQVAETALPAPSPAAFIDAATAFCNDVVWGTLGRDHPRQPLVDPGPGGGRRRRARGGGPALRLHRRERVARPLVRPGLARRGAPTPGTRGPTSSRGPGWWATRRCSTARRSRCVRGPFRSRPKPPWFATAPDAYDVMRRFVAFEAEPSAAKIPGLLLAAVRR